MSVATSPASDGPTVSASSKDGFPFSRGIDTSRLEFVA